MNAQTRLDGSRLLVARLAWLILVSVSMLIFAIAIPVRLTQLRTPCIGADCEFTQLAPEELSVLHSAGVTLDAYARFITGFETMFAAAFVAIGLLIAWRTSRNWFGLFASVTLITFGCMLPATTRALDADNVLLRIVLGLVQTAGWGSLFTFMYLFPTGTFAPAWTWTRPVILASWGVAWLVIPGANFFDYSLTIGIAVFFVWFCSGLIAQWYRYNWVSTPAQRQQTKWVVFGVFVAGAGTVILLTFLLIPTTQQAGATHILFNAVVTPLFGLSVLAIPISIAVAILRHHLFDIDVIINRTLVYSALTTVLASMYLGCIVVLQAGFRQFIGQTSPVAVVISTLVIAAAFSPLRRGIQRTIDRRFYRRKYDAEQALAAFSQTVRNEAAADLDALTDEVLNVVVETIQPAHVSLWLRPDQSRQIDEPH